MSRPGATAVRRSPAPTLLLAAHGSTNPDAAAVVAALTADVLRRRPDLTVRAGFLSHGTPTAVDLFRDLDGAAVAVPVLLTRGYHSDVDLPGLTGPAPVAVARPLGPDPLLTTALLDRLAEAGADPDAAVVLAAAGSSDPAAARDLLRAARLLSRATGTPVVPAMAAAGGRPVPAAVAQLRAAGHRVAVASYLLARGEFSRRVAVPEADWVTAPLGAHPVLAELVLRRYAAAS